VPKGAKARTSARPTKTTPRTPKVTLYGLWRSGPTYKVGLMLSLAGIPFAYEHIDLRAGAHKQPSYLSLNPWGQVPCIAVGKVVLAQSSSILEYMADRVGKFGGRTPEQRAVIRQWLFWDFDRLSPPVYRTRGIKLGLRQASEDTAAMYRTEAAAALTVLDQRLATSPFVTGRKITIADIAIYGVVVYAAEGEIDLTPYSAILAWMGRIEKMKGFGKPEQVLPQESRPLPARTRRAA
jgi:glutathione S-transferase